MQLEKWQALGNDYLIVERERLPFALTAARVRLLCDVHHGLGADGVLELASPAERGYVADLRIFNPDGSEAELSGNGAREAAVYLYRHGRAGGRELSLATIAGEVRARMHDERTCELAMGRARTASRDYPGGAPDGRGELDAGGRRWRFRHVQVGNPQVAIRLEDEGALAALDVAAAGAPIEVHAAFPNRTNVSFYAVLAEDEIRARIFERGVGETSASGTGASGAAIAHVLDGGSAPVTVRLDGGALTVDVDEAMLFTLTGWAEPVYRAELSGELLAALERAG